MQDKILKFIKVLKLKNPVIGINFTNKTPKDAKHFKDTACTALARVKNKKICVFFDNAEHRQLCSGADFFFALKNMPEKYARNVYVNDEHVFKNKEVCKQYLKSLPKITKKLIGKKIIIKPFQHDDNSQVIILIINPAQIGRILGLLNYNNFSTVKVYPCQPTCLSFFAPLVTNSVHINFIDYYDRYFQGKMNGKLLWGENEMIVSLTKKLFFQLVNNFNKSPHGSFGRMNINIKKIDLI